MFENVFLACASLKIVIILENHRFIVKIFVSNYVNETTHMALVFAENCREDDMQNYRLKFVDCAFSRKKFNV